MRKKRSRYEKRKLSTNSQLVVKELCEELEKKREVKRFFAKKGSTEIELLLPGVMATNYEILNKTRQTIAKAKFRL